MTETCLLIEDSAAQAKVMMHMLFSEGYNTIVAMNLQSAVKILDKEQIKTVFCDLFLPDCTDGSVVTIIKQLSPESIITAISAGKPGEDMTEALEKAKQAGADFAIPKPFSADKLKETLAEVKCKIRGEAKRYHVMVIDESPTIRKVCQKMIEEMGYKVTLCENLDTAAEKINPNEIDVILADITPSGGAPDFVLQLLSQSFPSVGIIAMTGLQSFQLNVSLAMGADTAIRKPFEASELDRAVRNAFVLSTARIVAQSKSIEAA